MYFTASLSSILGTIKIVISSLTQELINTHFSSQPLKIVEQLFSANMQAVTSPTLEYTLNSLTVYKGTVYTINY